MSATPAMQADHIRKMLALKNVKMQQLAEALLRGAQQGDLDIVDECLREGLSLECEDSQGFTALLVASR